MVKIITGMIGSGKTTYALKNKKDNDILLDWDLLVEAFSTENVTYIKQIQDYLLKFYADKNVDIWYITTALGSNEMELLETIRDVEYIWINTTRQQCLKNIIKRNRNDEKKYINNLDKANEEIQNKYIINKYKINYKIVDVFVADERW